MLNLLIPIFFNSNKYFRLTSSGLSSIVISGSKSKLNLFINLSKNFVWIKEGVPPPKYKVFNFSPEYLRSISFSNAIKYSSIFSILSIE